MRARHLTVLFYKGAMFLLIAAICGCATMKVGSDYAAGTDYKDLKTYAWLEGLKIDISEGTIDNVTLDRRIRRAVEGELDSKGYRKTAQRDADFLLGFHVDINATLRQEGMDGIREFDIKEYSSGTVFRFVYAPGRYSHRDYARGVLVLDVISPDAEVILWRGYVEAEVPLSFDGPEKKKKRVKKAAHRLLKRFPPR